MKTSPTIDMQFAGYYQFVAIKVDAEGNELSRRVAADWFPNIITDQGLERMGGFSDYVNCCQVGTGSTTPTVLDTGLVSRIAGANMTTSSPACTTSAPYYGYETSTYRFAAGVATGNLSEVGVGWDLTGSTLFSRALILDGAGAPTTITILADEILDINYQLRVYPPLADSSFNITISGVVHSCVLRAANVTNSQHWARFLGTRILIGENAFNRKCTATDGVIGAITAQPTGTSAAANGTSVVPAYIPGSLYNDVTHNFGLNDGNLPGGVDALYTANADCAGCYQISFSPPIMKDNTKTLALTFRISWSRKTLP